MADLSPSREIEIDSDPAFQRTFQSVERVAQILGGLLLVLILLGITGSGPLSRASSSGTDETIHVDYSRFAHRGASTTLRITVASTSDSAGEIQLWIDNAVMEDYELEQIRPEPDSSTLDGSRVLLSFAASSLDQESEIFLSLRPQRVGLQAFELGRVNGPKLEITQLVYP